MSDYWSEFLTVAIIHLLAVASPGPDFAVVLRQSLCKSRSVALWTSAGIGTGILFHVTYSLIGIGLLIAQSIWLFTALKMVGALYLLYVAWQCLHARPLDASALDAAAGDATGHWQAFRLGLLTNVLNPKATLFFVALFSVVIQPDTPKWVQGIYGLWMSVATAVWFGMVSWLLSARRFREAFRRHVHRVERLMGVVLAGLAARLFLATRD